LSSDVYAVQDDPTVRYDDRRRALIDQATPEETVTVRAKAAYDPDSTPLLRQPVTGSGVRAALSLVLDEADVVDVIPAPDAPPPEPVPRDETVRPPSLSVPTASMMPARIVTRPMPCQSANKRCSTRTHSRPRRLHIVAWLAGVFVVGAVAGGLGAHALSLVHLR
jgi:hypothetical protein